MWGLKRRQQLRRKGKEKERKEYSLLRFAFDEVLIVGVIVNEDVGTRRGLTLFQQIGVLLSLVFVCADLDIDRSTAGLWHAN